MAIMSNLMNGQEAAAFLGVTYMTLYTWGKSDNPPPYYKIGSMKRYSKEKLLEWANLESDQKQSQDNEEGK